MSDSLWPHESQHARPPCPPPTPGVHPNSCASSRWCHPAISSSVVPFSSCPQSLPAWGLLETQKSKSYSRALIKQEIFPFLCSLDDYWEWPKGLPSLTLKKINTAQSILCYDSWGLLRSSWAVAAYDITSVKVKSQDDSQISLNVKFTFILCWYLL